MTFCQPCKDLVQQHKKAARWVAFLLAMSLFFTVLGMVTDPVRAEPGECKIYP